MFTDKSGHGSSVTSLDCHVDNQLIISGSTDVTAKVISLKTGKVGQTKYRYTTITTQLVSRPVL